MLESDYYPMGAYSDPNAPFNEVEVPVKEWNCEVQVTIGNTLSIGTQNYTCEDDEGGIYYETDNVNWNDEYRNSHYSIMEMLDELKKYILGEMEGLRKFVKTGTANASEWDRWYHLVNLLEDCQGWQEVDLNVEKE